MLWCTFGWYEWTPSPCWWRSCTCGYQQQICNCWSQTLVKELPRGGVRVSQCTSCDASAWHLALQKLWRTLPQRGKSVCAPPVTTNGNTWATGRAKRGGARCKTTDLGETCMWEKGKSTGVETKFRKGGGRDLMDPILTDEKRESFFENVPIRSSFVRHTTCL